MYRLYPPDVKFLRASRQGDYLAIQRLEEQGLIEKDRGRPGSDARRRYYRLTELGREVAIAETRRLTTLVSVVHSKGLLGDGPHEGLPKAATERGS